jgi:uncharacterized protein YeaO (DUF488 family)
VIQVKRVYELYKRDDGARFLVDRLWPRGVKKENLPLQGWLKEVAPSDALRRWFAHDTGKWREFRQRYFIELDAKPEIWQPVLEAALHGNVTLLFAARNVEYNNAVALKEYLEKRLGAVT